MAVRVLSSKRRILLVAAAPDPDVAAIRRLLARNAAFEVSSFVQKSASAFYEGTFPVSLADFDVIVLAGYPGRVSDETVSRRIGEAAREGIPVFFLLTSATSIPRLGIISEDVLPVEAGRIREDFMEVAFQTTPAGNHHPVMHISGGDSEAWSALPPLEYSRTQWTLPPDAQALATVSVRGIDLPEPLLVVRRRAQHRTAALLGAGTWRWQNLPEDLSHFEQIPAELFANIIQWLTALEDDRPVRIYPVRDVFGGGESVQFSGQVYDESLNPVPDASVEIKLISPDGVEFPYLMHAIGSGRYTLDAGALPEGAYSWTATAQRGEEPLGSDRGEFVVGSLTLEYREPGADATLMRQVAQRSGGVLLDQNSPESFIEVLSAHLEGASDTISQTTEEDLRKHPALLLFIIVLLAAEWFFPQTERDGLKKMRVIADIPSMDVSDLPEAGAEPVEFASFLRDIRRHIHQHPELGFEEYRTSEFVRGILEQHGLAVQAPWPAPAYIRISRAPMTDLSLRTGRTWTHCPPRMQNPSSMHPATPGLPIYAAMMHIRRLRSA